MPDDRAEIRDIRYRDWSSLRVLFADCFPFVPENRIRYVLCRHKPGTRVAVRDGEVVGFTVLIPGKERGTAWLDWIGVRADSRERGLGRHLVDDLIRTAAERNFAKIRLGVDDDNPASLALFDSQDGFHRVGEGKRVTYEMVLGESGSGSAASTAAYAFHRVIWPVVTIRSGTSAVDERAPGATLRLGRSRGSR